MTEAAASVGLAAKNGIRVVPSVSYAAVDRVIVPADWTNWVRPEVATPCNRKPLPACEIVSVLPLVASVYPSGPDGRRAESLAATWGRPSPGEAVTT